MNNFILINAAIIFICGIIYFSWRIYKKIKQWQQIKNNKTLQEQITQDVLRNLYKKINGAELSRIERERLNINAYSLIYGEINFSSFADILAKTKPQTDDIFYDLGSGTGKAVLCAALLYDFSKACGIELLPALQQISLHLSEQLLENPKIIAAFPNKNFNIQFINDDLFFVDFKDADIVFVNATGFFGEEWEKLKQKLNLLKVGTRIILSSKQLSSPPYDLIHHDTYSMSWGDCSIYIYEKKL